MTANVRRGRRRRRRRAALHAAGIVSIIVLMLGFAAFGGWFLMDRYPQQTIVRYPLDYEETIRACAKENEIPPHYVAAVILAESSYRPDAVSSANAQGLMQILPSTAEWIARKLGESYVEGSLFEPETNIRYGCWYLGFLMERYGGDMRCASAAYHAGQGTVDEWLKDPSLSQDGRTLNAIKYDSTRTYVERVLKYCEKYEEIYA